MDKHGFWVRDTWRPELNRLSGVGKMFLFPHQRRILGEALSFNDEGFLKYETILYSCPKKSGKTALGASVGAWYASEAQPGTEVFCIANDLESAEGRLFRDIKFHFEQENERIKVERRTTKNYYKITQYRIDFPNGTFIQALAQSYKSVAGSRHALTLWDELWGVTNELSRRTWDEMTPIPTVTNSVRFISTYAGFENESDLLWELYLRGVGKEEHDNGRGEKIEVLKDLPCWKNGKLFTYWAHEGQMPWQTQEYYDEQMASERPAAFLRLHYNQWVTSHESFIPIEWWDAAAKIYQANANLWSDHPFRNWPITIGVDAGVKRDSTALVGVGYDSQRAKVGIVFHEVWSPSKGDQVDLDATVEKRLLELYNKYNVVSVVYDPTHLIQTMLRLKRRGLPTRDFTQNVPNMTSASQLLYDLFKNKNLEAYPDDILRRHIQMAVAESSSRGFRIVKSTTSKAHQVDGAIAMAMACYEAVSRGGADISIPVRITSPYSDFNADIQQEMSAIPPELRTDEEY